jgi:hypothetical protein
MYCSNYILRALKGVEEGKFQDEKQQTMKRTLQVGGKRIVNSAGA